MSGVFSNQSLPAGPIIGITGDVGGAHGGGAGLLRGANRFGGADFFMALAARCGAGMILLMLGALILVLAMAAVPSVKTFGLKFLVTSSWRPNERTVVQRDANGNIVRDADGDPVTDTLPAQFGALPVIYGTLVSSALALLVAVPLSFGAAIFLVRIAPRWHMGWLMGIVSFLIEFLAAIPSIAYGIWGLFVLAPLLQDHLEAPLNSFFGWFAPLRFLHTQDATTGRDMLCAGLILGIMILPIITAISRDVLKSVPRAQVEGTLALGATWWQSCIAMLRYARSGLFGAVMLGLARAAGETMAVAMVIGNATRISSSLFAPAQTMSSLLANEFAEASSDIHRSSLIQVALILLVMSLLFNVVARYLVVGKQVARA